jgi:CubicO group peptidase (beta-lactamase class C family)
MHGVVRPAAGALAVVAALAAAGAAGAARLESSLPAATAARVDRLFGDWIAADEPGAVVLVTRQGRPIFRNVYGLAHLELAVPAASDYVYQIGSLTKQVTALATLMLVGEGKLRLDTTLGAMLPGFPPQAQGITVEQLLGHTSGLVNYVNLPDWASVWNKEFQPDQLIDLFRRRPLASPPGSEFEYNNSGYVVLGRMIELVSGQRYADFVRTRIFEPLGMAHSSYNDWPGILHGRVPGYTKAATGWQNVRSPLHPSQLYAAGALLSTADDLARLQDAVADGRLVAPALVERMTSRGAFNDGLRTGYGFGWSVSYQRGRKVLEHGGANNGFYCAVAWLPDDEVWAVAMTNRYGFADRARELLVEVAKTAAGWPERETPARLDAATLEALAGSYRQARAGGEWIEVRAAADHLETRRRDGAAVPAYPRSPVEFFREGRPELLRFRRDEATGGLELITDIPYKGEQRWVRGALAAAPETEVPRQPAAAVDPAIYVGRYGLGAGVEVEVLEDHGVLLVNALGYQRVPLTPAGEHEFELALLFGRLRFLVEGGRATGLVFTQGGQEAKGQRID